MNVKTGTPTVKDSSLVSRLTHRQKIRRYRCPLVWGLLGDESPFSSVLEVLYDSLHPDLQLMTNGFDVLVDPHWTRVRNVVDLFLLEFFDFRVCVVGTLFRRIRQCEFFRKSQCPQSPPLPFLFRLRPSCP